MKIDKSEYAEYSVDELNHAIRILSEECDNHSNCSHCYLSNLSGECTLADLFPSQWEEVQDDEGI